MPFWETDMPRFEIGTSDQPLPAGVRQAFTQLDRTINDASHRVGHGNGFYCGRLCGTNIDDLYAALATERVDANDDNPGFRPILAVNEIGGGYCLAIPPARVAAHEQVMLASYVLRAHVDHAIAQLVPDHNFRNSIARNYVDGWLFGDYLRFLNVLKYFGALEQLHSEHDVPMGMVLGYAAKFNLRSRSLVSFYGLNPMGYERSAGDEYLLIGKSRVGRTRALTGYLGWLQAEGYIDVTAQHSQHVFLDDGLGKQVVAISSNVGGFYNADSGDRLGNVRRTIFCSSRNGFRGFGFTEGDLVRSH